MYSGWKHVCVCCVRGCKGALCGRSGAGEANMASGPTCKRRHILLSPKLELGGATAACCSAGPAPDLRGPRPPSRSPWWWRTRLLAGRFFATPTLCRSRGRRGSRPRPPPWIFPPQETPGSSRLWDKHHLLKHARCDCIKRWASTCEETHPSSEEEAAEVAQKHIWWRLRSASVPGGAWWQSAVTQKL